MDKPAKQLPHDNPEWKGYTLDEIRYARAYAAARMEINRERLMARVQNIQKNGMHSNLSKGLMGKVLGAFSYVDIALLTWRIGRKVFSMTRMLKK
ncbi:MAG: hypothetical protein K2J94_04440 [Duncaniella sp.]|nr:hypothetical protein [Duncaniella sp.]